MEPSEHRDWKRVLELGGPTKVADLLDLPKEGGVQRVQNWKHRGVPSIVKLERPDLFPHTTASADDESKARA